MLAYILYFIHELRKRWLVCYLVLTRADYMFFCTGEEPQKARFLVYSRDRVIFPFCKAVKEAVTRLEEDCRWAERHREQQKD